MYAFFFIAVVTWMVLIITDQITNNIVLIKNYVTKTQRYDVQVVSDAIMQNYIETGGLVSNLNTLSSRSGYEYVRTSISSRIGTASVANLTDSLWTYSRLGVFTLNTEGAETAAAYTAINKCGTGGFTTAASWCGKADTTWFRYETREKNNFDIVNQRNRQQRLMQKFSSYFNAQDTFPDKDAGNNSMAAGTTYSLASLAGFSGSASNCAGNFVWMGIPIDCDDMFDKWGGNVSYTFFSSTHIAIISTSVIQKNTGSVISIATDLNAT